MKSQPTPLPDYQYGPTYRPSWPNIARTILYVAAGRPRSLARDGLFALRDAPLPPLVRGADHIPTSGKLVIVANHYERPGLWMAWPVVLSSAFIHLRACSDIRWIAIQQWESFSVAGIPIPPWMTRLVFQRAFRTYGIIAMPPPHAPATTRAATIRAAVQVIREGGIVGLMPEGDVGPTPALLEAREGTGNFLLLLAAGGARFLPLGIYEEGGRMVLHTGESFSLDMPPDASRQNRDLWVRTTVMRRVKELLPQPLWGAYADTSKGTP